MNESALVQIAAADRRASVAEGAVLRLRRIHAVLSAMNSAIVRIDEPGPLYEETCRIATTIGGFPLAMVATIAVAKRKGTVQRADTDLRTRCSGGTCRSRRVRPGRRAGIIRAIIARAATRRHE